MTTIEQTKAELAKLRDEAKVQVHLGTMEARAEWDELEAKWNHFVAQAGLHQSAANIKSALEGLGQELRMAYQRLTKAL
jgi:hypothetical protein